MKLIYVSEANMMKRVENLMTQHLQECKVRFISDVINTSTNRISSFTFVREIASLSKNGEVKTNRTHTIKIFRPVVGKCKVQINSLYSGNVYDATISAANYNKIKQLENQVIKPNNKILKSLLGIITYYGGALWQ